MAIIVISLISTLIILGKDVGVQQSFAHSIHNVPDYLNAERVADQIVYPERIDHNRAKRDLSTRDHHKDYDDEARFKVQAFGKSVIIDVKRNKVMIPKDFFIRSFSKEGKEIVEKPTVKSCHYQGHVQGHSDSFVLLDKCLQDGLSGIIDVERDRFSIEPMKSKGFNAHRISRIKGATRANSAKTFSCGSRKHIKEKEGKQQRSRRSSVIHPLFRSHVSVSKTRYTELIIIVDKPVYDKYGSNKTQIEQRIIALVNAVDMIYQKINIRIIMKALEIWSEKDLVNFTKKAGEDLNNLQKYREKHMRRYKCDALHLLRGQEWIDHGGMAYMGEMCTVRSTGVVWWNEWSNLGPWLALAHEMGHNFGFDHDDLKKCKCLTPRGCIMRTFKTRIPGFSDCNLRDLRKIDDSCLYNIPVKVHNIQCGNGIKEGSEQCDCGTPENCAVVDLCCNPKTCSLYSSSQCSDRHDKCCKQCQFSPTGTLCRHAKGECDVPEYCTGQSGQCPSDDHKLNGTPCQSHNLELVGNNIDNSFKLTRLARRIKARYVRINPKHWHKDICMRTEIYGCDKALPSNSPTSLRSNTNLCVEAKFGLCDSTDVSKLSFVQADDCTVRNMQFRISNGVLIHHCTGNMVCPENSYVTHGTKLVVKKSCTRDSARFERVGYSLKHIQSGYCVHPSGGLAQDGVLLVLWPGCKGSRIALAFINQDCEVALGMENGGIRNDKIKASSFQKNREALHARLNGLNGWCAGKMNKIQHLQIDLGKVKLISGIATEGMYDGRRVTGYNLYYSHNGQRWIAYTGSKNRVKNSYCFRGRCSKTRDSQCRDLWGPTSSSSSSSCYRKFNTDQTVYGTCDPDNITSCQQQNVMCGQLQCLDKTKRKPIVDYGLSYKRVTLPGNKKCSLVERNTKRFRNFGMVKQGTKCGHNKICVNQKCRPFQSVNTQACPRKNGQECAGNGFCTAQGKCHCNQGYDPLTNCSTDITIDDGGWTSWSSWTDCSRMCGSGTKTRYRFCNDPVPSHGGRKCSGNRIQTRRCDSGRCPVVHSCRHLQAVGRKRGIDYPSGVYTINPDRQGNIKTYCDMTRDGGGWTLLVTSHTNNWTPSNVQRRAENDPRLDQDFSILFRANSIKNAIKVRGKSFEYRIEAQSFGRWGGIWKAPRSYSFTSTNNKQTQVNLIKKFDNWKYEDFGIEKRMPWIHGGMLTTSHNATKYAFGSIIANIERFYPAPWINAKENEQHPTNIWYWMREGHIKKPGSCMELQQLGLQSTPQPSGIHVIKLSRKNVKTYCDFTTDGGGWTLLVTSSSRTGWTRKTVGKRNVARPSLHRDYSILSLSEDIIKGRHFQYRIEDETKGWGGIFEAKGGQSFLSGLSNQTEIKLLKKHGDWDETSNFAQRLPYAKDSSLLLTTAVLSGDYSGTLVSSSSKGIYLARKKESPSVLRIWVREGTWRSCNEIKQRGNPSRQSLEDGIYMIKNTSHQYVPVMCDMNSDLGAWTLLVTSANNGWQPSQVKYRNTNLPSLTQDYSILGLGNQIKELSGGKTFMYKLEANEHGHWGGVWKAPIHYSFVATNNSQTNVTLVKKYDDWHYSWQSSLEKRMPWIGKRKGLLTTSTDCDYHEWGTVISDNNIKNLPAPWIDYFMVNPGVIWYWVNEDDCGPNRKQVDGGLSSWSAWGECSPLCSTSGLQTRKRLCTNPAPRCGGRPCDGVIRKDEKRKCNYCPKSPIRSRDNLCIQPSTADCNPPENTRLVYKKNSNNCDQANMNFLYDKDGSLMHQCSGKYVCPKGGRAGYDTPLVLSSLCTKSTVQFEITKNNGLKVKQSEMCVHPYMGRPTQGIHLVTWRGCDSPGGKLLLELFRLKAGEAPFLTTSPPQATFGISTATGSRDSPIRSHGGFCLQPMTSDCSPPDGTEITYHGTGGNNVQCSTNYMLFTLTTTGVLKHSCSGMYVCPDPDYLNADGTLYNGVPVVLKKNCTFKQAKYTRTRGKSLRYKSTGFCVHPESGTPTSGTKAVFWDQCDLTRLELEFYNLHD